MRDQSRYREATTIRADTGRWFNRDLFFLIHHPGASRHPSCPGGAIEISVECVISVREPI